MNDGIVDISLNWDTTDAEHSLSDFAKKIVKTFDSMNFDPVATLEKDLKTAEKNIDELQTKINSLTGQQIPIEIAVNKNDIREQKTLIKELEKQIEEAEKKYNKMAPGHAQEKAKAELKRMTNDLSVYKAELEELQRPQYQYVNAENTAEYKELVAELENQKHSYEALKNYQEQYMNSVGESTNKVQDQDDIIEMIVQDTKSYTEQINVVKNKMDAINEQLSRGGLGSGEVDKLASEFEKLNNQLIDLKNKQKEAENATNSHTRAVKEHANSQRSLRSGLNLSLGNILRYAIGIQSIYSLFSKLRSAAKEGLGYVVNASGSLKNSVNNITSSFTQMKAAVGAAVAPLIQLVSPIIARIAQLFTIAANAVARFFAVLSGKKTVQQAKLNLGAFNKSVGGAGKAAKQASDDVKKALAPFDDLNVLADETADSLDDMSGGLGGAADGSQMFETLDLDDYDSEFLNKIKEWLDNLNLEPITEAWEHLKNALKDFFDICKKTGMWVLENVLLPLASWLIESALPPIIDAIAYAIDALNISLQILAPILQAVWDSLQPFIKIIGDAIVSALELIRDKLKDLTDWLDQHRDTPEGILAAAVIVVGAIWLIISVIGFLKDHLFKAKKAVDDTGGSVSALGGIFSTFFDSLGRAVIIASIALLFKAFGDVIEALTGLVEAMNDADMKWYDIALIILAILVPLATAIGILVAAIPIDAAVKLLLIAAAIDLIAIAIEKILGAITDLIDRPLNTLIEFIEKIKESGPEVVQKVNDIKTAISELKTEITNATKVITTKFTEIAQSFAKEMDSIKKKFSETSKFLSDKLLELDTYVKKTINEFLKFVKEKLIELETQLRHKMDDIERTISNFIRHINEKITKLIEDTEKNADKFKQAFEKMSKAVADAASAIASTPIRPVVDTSSIDAGIAKLNTFLSLMAQAGSASVSVSTPSVGFSVPKMASGGVLPPNQPFLAMLGDQKQGTNIEAPLETITNAMMDALRNSNYSTGGGEVVLNIDGTELARVLLPHDLAELNRQGYNVSVLEGK